LKHFKEKYISWKNSLPVQGAGKENNDIKKKQTN